MVSRFKASVKQVPCEEAILQACGLGWEKKFYDFSQRLKSGEYDKKSKKSIICLGSDLKLECIAENSTQIMSGLDDIAEALKYQMEIAEQWNAYFKQLEYYNEYGTPDSNIAISPSGKINKPSSPKVDTPIVIAYFYYILNMEGKEELNFDRTLITKESVCAWLKGLGEPEMANRIYPTNIKSEPVTNQKQELPAISQELTHSSEMLEALIAAIGEFWEGKDPDTAAKQATNEAVSFWLQQNYSL